MSAKDSEAARVQRLLWHVRTFSAPIFPVEPNGKRPVTQHGLKDATDEEKAIRALAKKHPNHNWAMRTGVWKSGGIVVLDIDVREDRSGEESLKALPAMPATVEVATPSGGRHLYFAAAGFAVKSRNGKLGAGLDVKGEGGYVLIPPSTIDGRAYRFVRGVDG